VRAWALRAATLAALASAGCSRPGEERAYAELEIGSASFRDGLAVSVAGGLARIAHAAPGELSLWAQAPVLDVALTVPPGGGGAWQIEVQNVPADCALSIDGGPPLTAAFQERVTSRFTVTLPAGERRLRLAPLDADTSGTFRFLALGDIQTALPTAHELFAVMNRVPDARFAVFMGDLTERAELEEYQLAAAQLATLELPFYATLGNHELWEDPERFFSRFGRASFHFSYRGVAFTFADSGDAGLDPIVEGWVDDWLAEARDQVHVFLSHFPPIDPSGARDGSYRSRRDGHRLLGKLARGGVDLTLFGHVHTFLAYENAGIPSFISGGGGARQEQWDGISTRHFLVVDISAGDGVEAVALRRVE
jgi:predicted phosphodiesterase